MLNETARYQDKPRLQYKSLSRLSRQIIIANRSKNTPLKLVIDGNKTCHTLTNTNTSVLITIFRTVAKPAMFLIFKTISWFRRFDTIVGNSYTKSTNSFLLRYMTAKKTVV